MMRYSSSVTIGLIQFLGSIAVSRDDWKNGPASQTYIHGLTSWAHSLVQNGLSHRHGRSLNRFMPSMSNSQLPYLTGNGTGLPPEFRRLRFSLSLSQSRVLARFSGKVF